MTGQGGVVRRMAVAIVRAGGDWIPAYAGMTGQGGVVRRMAVAIVRAGGDGIPAYAGMTMMGTRRWGAYAPTGEGLSVGTRAGEGAAW